MAAVAAAKTRRGKAFCPTRGAEELWRPWPRIAAVSFEWFGFNNIQLMCQNVSNVKPVKH